MTNLISIFKKRVQENPNSSAYIFLPDGDKKEKNITYLELWNRTSLIANYLRYEVNKKSRVLLLYPQGLEFLTAFLGCLNADMIAVPAYPPKGNQKMSRLQAIIKNCQPDVILTTSSLLEKVKSKLGQIIDSNQIKCICTDQLGTISEELADNLTIDNEIAFLQASIALSSSPLSRRATLMLLYASA